MRSRSTLEELEKYQRIRGLNLKMLDRIEVGELVCGVSSASEILEVRKWVEKMQDADQRLVGTRVVSFDVEDDDDVFLEAEEERTEKVASPKRMSAALRFSRKVVERTPTYDERIEGSARDSLREEMDLELDVPWEDRMF